MTDSPWTYWPSAARARAFAAMLLMPEDGIYKLIRHFGSVSADSVREIMKKFSTGPVATTWHLHNLRMISETERVELLIELQIS